jgi:hypothetical protein
MSQCRHILTFAGRKTVILLDLENKADALKIARMLVAETGQSIIVRDEELNEIETVLAPLKS